MVCVGNILCVTSECSYVNADSRQTKKYLGKLYIGVSINLRMPCETLLVVQEITLINFSEKDSE
jgi:hypothetical protein